MPSENNIGPIFQILPTTPVIWQHNKARFTFNIIISLRTYFQNDKANEVLVSVQPFGDIFRKLFQNNYNLVNIISSLLAKPPWFQISNETDSILYTESEKKNKTHRMLFFTRKQPSVQTCDYHQPQLFTGGLIFWESSSKGLKLGQSSSIHLLKTSKFPNFEQSRHILPKRPNLEL